jgi:class 3 adenylate cyclase
MKPRSRGASADAGGNRPELESLGEVGILFADLSGYTQVVYQCVSGEDRLRRLSVALYRLFNGPGQAHPDISVEGYAGDGFLAFSRGRTPVRTLYDFALTLHRRFDAETRPLMLNLGFRASAALRTGLHIGRVWRMRLSEETEMPRYSNISDAINVASRVVAGQVCRRRGLAVTRDCYRRLLYAGRKEVREPDEVIQDRNQYPEPIEIYHIRPEEHQQIIARPAGQAKNPPA